MNKSKVMKLREMVTACSTVAEIAKALKINENDVEAKIIELGHKPIYERAKEEPKPQKYIKIERKTRQPLTAEEKKQIVALKKQGKGTSAIAEKFGIAPGTVCNIVRVASELEKRASGEKLDDTAIAEEKPKTLMQAVEGINEKTLQEKLEKIAPEQLEYPEITADCDDDMPPLVEIGGGIEKLFESGVIY